MADKSPLINNQVQEMSPPRLGSSLYPPVSVCRPSLEAYISVSRLYDEQSRQHSGTKLMKYDQFHFFLMSCGDCVSTERLEHFFSSRYPLARPLLLSYCSLFRSLSLPLSSLSQLLSRRLWPRREDKILLRHSPTHSITPYDKPNFHPTRPQINACYSHWIAGTCFQMYYFDS